MAGILVEKGSKQNFIFGKPELKDFEEGHAWTCTVHFDQFDKPVQPLMLIPLFKTQFNDDPEIWVAVSAFYDLLDNIYSLTMPGFDAVFIFHDQKVIDAIKKSDPVIEKMHVTLTHLPFEFITHKEAAKREKENDKSS